MPSHVTELIKEEDSPNFLEKFVSCRIVAVALSLWLGGYAVEHLGFESFFKQDV